MKIFIFVCLILISSILSAQLRETIINHLDCPIRISKFNAVYSKGNNSEQKGLNLRVHFYNQSQKSITAVEIGFISYDIWDNYLGLITGLQVEKLDRREETNKIWIDNSDDAYTFFTGFAFVSRVRYSDGEFWKGSLEHVANKIRAEYPSLDLKPFLK